MSVSVPSFIHLMLGIGCHPTADVSKNVTQTPPNTVNVVQSSAPEVATQQKVEEEDLPQYYQDSPLTGLPRLELYLGDKTLNAELALDTKAFATGMMHRKEIPDDAAMLFVYGVPTVAAFYMKNTYVPLSCAYIDAEGIILELHDLEPLNEESVVSKTDNVRYVLEVKQGWFKKNNITEGTLITTAKGTMLQVFPMY